MSKFWVSVTKALLGVDYGRARTGLALAVEDESPQRLTTLTVGSPQELAEALKEVIAAHNVTTLVVGLPRGVDGDDTAWTQEVRVCIDQLRAALADVEIVLQDEFGTSSMAREQLAAEGVSEKEQKELVDQQAAVILLEDYVQGA